MNNEQQNHSNATSITRSVKWRNRKSIRWLIRFGLLGFVLLAFYIVGAVMISTVSFNSLQSANRVVLGVGPWFALIRWSAIALFIFYWKPINEWFARRNHWSDARLQLVLTKRWYALGVLILVELVFMQRLLEMLFDKVN